MSRRRIAPNEAIKHSPEVSPGVPMAAGRQERPPGTDHGMSRGIARAAFFRRIVSRKNQAPAVRVSGAAASKRGQRHRRGASTFGSRRTRSSERKNGRTRNAGCYAGVPTSWNSASIRAMCRSLRTQGLRSARMLMASARWCARSPLDPPLVGLAANSFRAW